MENDIDKLTEAFGPYTVTKKGINRNGETYWNMKFEREGVNTNTFRYYNKDGSVYQMNPDGSSNYFRNPPKKGTLTWRDVVAVIAILIFVYTGLGRPSLGYAFFLIFGFVSLLAFLNIFRIMSSTNDPSV